MPPGGTVLVIDDEDLVRKVARRLLQSLGYEAECAASGEEGLKVFAEKRDAIVLTLCDLSMPGMDGAEVLSRLRAIDPKARVLIVTGLGDEDVPDRVRDARPDGVLSKPFTVVEFRRAVDEVASAPRAG